MSCGARTPYAAFRQAIGRVYVELKGLVRKERRARKGARLSLETALLAVLLELRRTHILRNV